MKNWLLASAIAAPLIALATPAFANHSWGGYHWARTSNPFTLKLGDNVSARWDSHLNLSHTDWSKSTVLDTTDVAGQAGDPKRCNAVAGRVEVCNALYGQRGWLGIASISITGGTHITQGIVKLNDTYFNLAQYDTVAWRNLVMCQEIGHTFGLGHQDENFSNLNLDTCMDYTNSPGSNQHPNGHDYDQLVAIYLHTDTSTNIAASTASIAAVGDTPAEWGRAIRFLPDGRPDMFERIDGPGAKTLTHVFWAVGEGPRGNR